MTNSCQHRFRSYAPVISYEDWRTGWAFICMDCGMPCEEDHKSRVVTEHPEWRYFIKLYDGGIYAH